MAQHRFAPCRSLVVSALDPGQNSNNVPRRQHMRITRRHVFTGSAALAGSLACPAIRAAEPIRIGFLPALTGPSSSTGIAINRGTMLAVEEINAAGGVNGRPIELIVRDTQSDPTKAVNAAAELAQGQHVHVIYGPLNSG